MSAGKLARKSHKRERSGEFSMRLSAFPLAGKVDAKRTDGGGKEDAEDAG